MKILSVLIGSLLMTTLIACNKKKDDTSGDPTAPSFSTAVTASNLSSTGFTLTWAATDDVTIPAEIKYKVVRSLGNNISTAADAEANGTLVVDYTAGSTTTILTSLSPATKYYVAVLAKDNDSKVTVSSTSVTTLCNGKIMFVATATSGNMGGISGADALCNAQKPTGFSASTFKAMLAGSGTRGICYVSGNDSCYSSSTGQADWVFSANQTICSSDYSTKIGTTTSNKLLEVENLPTSSTNVFLGFNIAWGTSTSNNCSNWSSTSGTATASTTTSFLAGFQSCASAGAIYCVQQ